MNKQVVFDKMIWEDYRDAEHFDKITFQLNRIRELMIKSNPSFDKMGIKRQYEYCTTICLIATQSATKAIRRMPVITEPKADPLPYAVDEGYIEPKKVSIDKTLIK